LNFTEWDFWLTTPRKLIASLDEYWYLEHMKNYEAGSYNLQFIALLFSEGAKEPALPERKNKPPKIVTTNDAGLAMLKGIF